MAAIQYITKRLMVEGEKNLQKLSDEGFMGVWRTLTDLAKNPAKADSVHIRFNANHKIQAEDFKGFTGFFRKVAESVKVLWDKWTGHLAKLIEDIKALTAKRVANQARRPIREVRPPDEVLTKISSSLSAENRYALSREVYQTFKQLQRSGEGQNLPKELQAVGVNILKNNRFVPLTDFQVHQLMKHHNSLLGAIPKSSQAALRDKIAAALNQSGITPKKLNIGQPVQELSDRGLIEKTTALGETNIRALSESVGEASTAFVNRQGNVLFKPEVVVPKFKPINGVQLSTAQDKQLMTLYAASKSGDKQAIQTFRDKLADYMQKHPDDFLTEHLAMAKQHGTGDAFMIQLLQNPASGRMINPKAKEIIANLKQNPEHLEKMTEGLQQLLQDPLLLSKMPQALAKSL